MVVVTLELETTQAMTLSNYLYKCLNLKHQINLLKITRTYQGRKMKRQTSLSLSTINQLNSQLNSRTEESKDIIEASAMTANEFICQACTFKNEFKENDLTSAR